MQWTQWHLRLRYFAIVCVTILTGYSFAEGKEKGTPKDPHLLAEWKKDILPLLEHYCYDCHGYGSSKGGLDLDQYPDLASMRKKPKVWEHILARVDYRLMPPVDEEQPDDGEREKLIAWINQAIFPSDIRDPGRRTPRRLNALEYQNTLQDLLGVKGSFMSLLPPDDSSHGFDNNANALSISPAHIEKYLQAAEKALDTALFIGPMLPHKIDYQGKDFQGDGLRREDAILLFMRGRTTINPKIQIGGNYRLKITASASQAGNELAEMTLSLNGDKLKTFQIKGHIDEQHVFTKNIQLPKGTPKISLAFPNDYYDPKAKDPKLRDRNLLIHRVSLEGPLDIPREKPASHHRVFIPRQQGQDEKSYAHAVLSKFGRRAFRRPLDNQEILRYVDLAHRFSKQNNSLEEGIKNAISAMLVSPSFLYISDFYQDKSKNAPGLISEHALASRLSYFLWSSMPDEDLLTLADSGKLRMNLDAQVKRMLKDERANQMVENFVGQWLQLRDLESITPDIKRFPRFSRSLADDMRMETTLLSKYIFLENQSLLDFLDADYSFINEPLARLYKISNVKGKNFRRISTSSSKRRGILTHGSILTLTSQPDRTSPVLRGKFVLENILDITPPPPPPDLPELEEEHEDGRKLSIREQLAMHSKKTACAGCHNLMDPVGLAFENYNAIGVWREFENGRFIDSSGKLVTGEAIDGAESLRQIILNEKSDEFLRCLTVKLMTYAIGRGVTRQDRVHISHILNDLQKQNHSAHALILGVVKSVPFQYQRN